MYIPTWGVVLLVIIIYFLLGQLDEKIDKVNELEMIRISIKPHWYQLLKDHNVIKGMDEKEFYKKIDIKDSIYHRGVNFTVLKPKLIYSNDWHSFMTELNFRAQLEEFSPSISEFVGFYVKESRDGYELGIRTPESAKKSYHPRDNNDLIKVAAIPYSALGLYNTHSIKQDIRDKILKEYGLEKEPSDESADEAGWNDRTLHHKYYDVNYEYL